MLIEVRIALSSTITETINRAGTAIRKAKLGIRSPLESICVFGPKADLDGDGRPTALIYRVTEDAHERGSDVVWGKYAQEMRYGDEQDESKAKAA